MKYLSETDINKLLSEIDDFECIWSKETKVLIDSNRKYNDNNNNRIEKLFICKK